MPSITLPICFSRERTQLLGVVRSVPLRQRHPRGGRPGVLGNKGAGKTHLLHSIKHGTASGWQLLVTPGTYQKDADFLEYLLFQVIDTLAGRWDTGMAFGPCNSSATI